MSTDSLRPVEVDDERKNLSVQEEIDSDRLSSIFSTRSDVRELRLETSVATGNGIGTNQANNVYLNALQSLLLELYPFAENAPEYWTGDGQSLIGAVQIPPPPPPNQSDIWERLEPGSYPSAKPYNELEPRLVWEIGGLLDILRAPDDLTATFITYQSGMGGRRYFDKAERRMMIPRYHLDRAVEWTFHFMNIIGLDLDLAPGETDVNRTDPF